MHTLLGLGVLLLVVFLGYVALAVQLRERNWGRRRQLQLAVLAAPVLALGVALLALHHFQGRVCFVGAPPWDVLIGPLLPWTMTAIMAVALVIA